MCAVFLHAGTAYHRCYGRCDVEAIGGNSCDFDFLEMEVGLTRSHNLAQ